MTTPNTATLLCSALLLSALTVRQAQATPAEPPAATEVQAATPQEVNLNLFRNPSIGLEYRRGDVSLHGGAYPTIISRGADGQYDTSWFLRAGVTTYFLGHSFYEQRPSEFYASVSYLRGLNLGRGNAALLETGYRWMVGRG